MSIALFMLPQSLDEKTMPGFTEAAGIPFEDLVETILNSALRSEAAAKL